MLNLPRSLVTPYRSNDTRYIARLPFLLNDSVDTAMAENSLQEIPLQPNEIFLGVAGLRSLDLLAQAGFKRGHMHEKAVLFDMNVNQVKAMNGILHLIRHADTPDAFITSFAREYQKWVNTLPRQGHPRQTEEDQKFFSIMGTGILPHSREEAAAELRAEQIKPTSWLHPRNFGRIKAMVERGDIETIAWDMSDKARTETLRQWLDGNNLSIGTTYLSSVMDFLVPDRVFDYYSRVKAPGSDQQSYTNLNSLLMINSRILASEMVPIEEQEARHQSGLPQFILNVRDRGWLANRMQNQTDVPDNVRYFRYTFSAGDDVFDIHSLRYQDRQGRPTAAPDGGYHFAIKNHCGRLYHGDLAKLLRALEGLGFRGEINNQFNVPVFVIPSHFLSTPQAITKVFSNIEKEIQALWPQSTKTR